MQAKPGAQQRPEAFDGVDVNFAETVAIFVARILTAGVTDCLMRVAPGVGGFTDPRIDEAALLSALRFAA
jgi:hypothetical protein